jgi:hypothetical protein
MASADDLARIAPRFVEMAHRIVWCVAATADRSGEVRTRVLHPLWEWDGSVLRGWILTSPNSPKARHLADNPRLSLTYWDATHDTCSADCDTTWELEPDQRQAGWDLFLHGPEPVAFDPAIVPPWTSPSAPEFGVLLLEPRRLRLMDGTAMLTGEGDRLSWSS